MILKHLWNKGKPWVVRGLEAVEGRVKTWTQPAPDRAYESALHGHGRNRRSRCKYEVRSRH